MDYPTTIDGALALAERLVRRFRETQSAEDMFAAVLAVVHVVEWDDKWRSAIDAGHKDQRYCDLRDRHREWNKLRGVANGLKHVSPKHGTPPHHISHDDPEWESDDFWMRAGLGVQYVEIDGERLEIGDLCEKALSSIRRDLAAR